jgi:hypothetical protein
MCINASLVLMLRALINDLDSETYTDNRLEQLVAIAAKFVNQDVEASYVVDIMSPDIVPDPIEVPDEIFSNLTVVKAACLIDQSNLRVKAALAGISASAGPASLSVGGAHFSAFKDIIDKGACHMYKEMLRDYKLGSGAICHGILSPFISNTFDPTSLNFSDYSLRDER